MVPPKSVTGCNLVNLKSEAMITICFTQCRDPLFTEDRASEKFACLFACFARNESKIHLGRMLNTQVPWPYCQKG